MAGLPEVVEGVELDPNAAWLANVVLAAEALPLLAAVSPRQRRPLPELVHCGDGLQQCERPAGVEVQNPPYGRVKLTVAERERWSHVLYGHANLYGLFMAAATGDLGRDGVLAALVPTSFMSGRYFEPLRAILAGTVRLRSVSFVTDRSAFDNVLQETCLVTFTRRRARVTSVRTVGERAGLVARVRTPAASSPWLLPRRLDDAGVAAAAATMTTRLSEFGYRCSTGPLVWNRRSADLSAAPSQTALPVVWGADIDGGELHRDHARDVTRYLRLTGTDEKVMVQSTPAVLIQRTTAPEQTRRLVAAELSTSHLERWGGAVVVENHVNVLTPTADAQIDTATLTAILSTTTIDRVLRCLSGSVAISAYELQSIPFPPVATVRSWVGLREDLLERAVAMAYGQHL